MLNDQIYQSMTEKGYAIRPSLLSPDLCKTLIQGYDDSTRYRKTIDMQRFRFGQGEYKYFQYPLPEMIQQLRNDLYVPLAGIANEWANYLNTGISYPDNHAQFITMCREKNQARPTLLILRYEPGGFNTLHQDLYGQMYFPVQAVIVLNQSGLDFTGGEFVMTEQIPRAQSKSFSHPTQSR